ITNISTLQDDVVFRLVEMLDVELKPQTRRVLTAGGTTVPDAYEFYLLGRGYLLRSDNEESLASAIGLFDQAIEKDSSYALAYAGLGEAYWLKWKLTKNPELTKMAQSYCEHAIQLSESLAPVRVTLGIIYRDTSKYEDAIKEFKQALLLDPVSSDAYRELALTYQKLGRPEEAEDTYKRAIELKPDYWSGYSHLGVFYLKHARYVDAEEMFRHVTELTPDNPENALGYNNLGASYLYMGRFNEAIAMFKKSIAIYPRPDACSNLGTLYFFQSRYTDAMDMYEKAIDLGKKDYTIWGNLADAYRYIPEYSEKAREAYQRAIQLAEELLAINPRDSELHGKLARYYAILEDHEKALAEISKARELTPSNVRVLFNCILVFELANQRDQAIQVLQEYIERGGSMEKVRGEPDLSELRKDPRYQQLIKKEGSGVFDSPKINK
ncbi:MAG: tetratricopeptide repeat protein, partial [Candidatus Omnitrophota bacterium]